MKLLFYFDAERVCIDSKGNYYASGNFPMSVWERYLKIADKLCVVMREGQKNVNDPYILKKRELVDRNKIDMRLVKDIFGNIVDYVNQDLRRYNVELTESLVKENDFIIVRGVNKTVIKFAKKYKKPYMIESIGCTWDAFWNHGLKGKVLAIPAEYNTRKYIKEAPWVLYVTNEYLQRKYPTDGRNIGVSDVAIENLAEGIIERRIKKIEQSDDEMVLGTAAAIDVKYKGQEYVIRALGKLKEKGIKVSYQLVGLGTGEYLKRVARDCGVSDRVQIVGQLSHNKVFEWMDSIDVYIQPSLQEGLPRAVVEAMSRGLPVLGTNVGGIPELIGKDELLKKKSVNEIARQIENMKKNRMISLAKINFEKARKYDKDLLDNKRNEFFHDFSAWAEAQL